MKKSFFGICAMAIFALAFTSNSFDNTAFTANTVAEVVTPTIQGDMDFDGRNSASISSNGTSSSISGSGTASVSSEGGTGSASVSSSSSGSSSTSSTTTTGGSNFCDFITSSYLRSLLGCD